MVERIEARELKRGIQKAYERLNAHREEINALNVFPVPDGDTGTNMSLTVKSAVEAVDAAGDTVGAVTKALGSGSLMGARGNSGVILSQLCRGIAQATKGLEVLTINDVPVIFESARAKAYKAVMQPTEGTILTISRAMAEFAIAHDGSYTSIQAFLTDILRHANRTLQKTPEMLQDLKEAGVVDAGGQGLVHILAGLIEGVYETDVSEVLESSLSEGPETFVAAGKEGEKAQKEKSYYVSFQINGIEKDRLERHLESYGLLRSLEKSADGYRVEALTDQPLKLLTSQAKRGSLIEAEIRKIGTATKEAAKKEERPAEPVHAYGFVAVSAGEGFADLFRNLMVDEIVTGGQTMNPSTQELLQAVNRVPAKTVFLFPNNKNIILAAQQVPELTEKEVVVIPSRTMPEGVSALFHFDEGLSPEGNRQAMEESLKSVITGQVTHAVRNSERKGLKIQAGDLIGLVGGDIVARDQNVVALLESLIESYLDQEHTLLTVYTGEEAKDADNEALKALIAKKWPSVEVEFAEGLQPIYPYIFSIE